MHRSNVWLATALLNDRVRNSAGESLGKIENLVIDPGTGNIQYAVLSFGGVLGMGSKLFAIPWTSLQMSAPGDGVLLSIDKEILRHAPGFDAKDWPNMADPAWQHSIHDYYRVAPPVPSRPAVVERSVYNERRVRPAKHGMSLLAGIALVCLVLGLAWVTFMVATRGWDQAKQDMKTSLQGAAYAAKETSHDAALTTKVKSALSLSKRVPADKINVDSEDDVVTLRGEVPSDQARDLAEQIARDVPGVREVHDHLFVTSRTQ
jgi:sporulation protein YlmC with PRC-barrel domain